MVICAPAGAGKTYFLEHELKPALAAHGLQSLEILDQFEDHLTLYSTGLLNPRVALLDARALPQFERLGRDAIVVSLPPRDIVEDECRVRGFGIEPSALLALREYNAGAYLVKRGLERLVDAERVKRWDTIRQSTLDGFGGAERLILESLDGQISELNATSQELLFRWCNLLITPEGGRSARSEKELTDYAGKWNRFVLTGLPRMLQLGLLRQVERPEGSVYEIAHPCLVAPLRDWWKRREASLIAKKRAQFRVRSVSVAGGLILALYVVWMIVTWNK